jgi:hypothetical protein
MFQKIFSILILIGISTSIIEAQDVNVKGKGKKSAKSKMVEPTDPKETEVWEPIPAKITPGAKAGDAPSDAIVLFDGSNSDAFTHLDGSPVKWTLSNGALTVKPQSGDIKTRDSFGSCQLHIEWRAPDVIKGDGQGRGNSGIFLSEKYEVQVLDSYESKTYPNGQASSIYKQHVPLVNANKAPGEWQTYDIIYKAPKFDKRGRKLQSGSITVLHNGVLTQNNIEIKGTTEYIGWPKNPAHGDGALKLQDHGDLVSYRNIWIRKL